MLGILFSDNQDALFVPLEKIFSFCVDTNDDDSIILDITLSEVEETFRLHLHEVLEGQKGREYSDVEFGDIFRTVRDKIGVALHDAAVANKVVTINTTTLLN